MVLSLRKHDTQVSVPTCIYHKAMMINKCNKFVDKNATPTTQKLKSDTGFVKLLNQNYSGLCCRSQSLHWLFDHITLSLAYLRKPRSHPAITESTKQISESCSAYQGTCHISLGSCVVM